MAVEPLRNTTFEGIGLVLHLGLSAIERGNAGPFVEESAPIIARPFVLNRPHERQDLGLMATQQVKHGSRWFPGRLQDKFIAVDVVTDTAASAALRAWAALTTVPPSRVQPGYLARQAVLLDY